jgi:hypothetical protein
MPMAIMAFAMATFARFINVGLEAAELSTLGY